MIGELISAIPLENLHVLCISGNFGSSEDFRHAFVWARSVTRLELKHNYGTYKVIPALISTPLPSGTTAQTLSTSTQNHALGSIPDRTLFPNLSVLICKGIEFDCNCSFNNQRIPLYTALDMVLDSRSSFQGKALNRLSIEGCELEDEWVERWSRKVHEFVCDEPEECRDGV